MGRVRGRRSIVAVATIFGLAFLGSPVRAAGESYVVTSLADTTADDGACTLREAILAANNAAANDDCGPASPNDDTITFFVSGTITLGSTLPSIAGGGLTIDGSGAITVSGGGTVRVLETDPDADVTLLNITISGGYEDFGGGILNDGVLLVIGSTISGNEVVGEGGGKGGGIFNTGRLTVADSTISDNVASGQGSQGGGIYNAGGEVTVIDSTISGNAATDLGSGGGIYNDGGTVVVMNSTISRNSATSSGGGIDADRTVTVINSTISGNEVTYTYARGGGIAFRSGSLMIIHATIAFNRVDGDEATDAGISPLDNTSGVFFKNSIVALNQGGQNCSYAPMSTSGTNFATDDSCFGFTQVTAAALNLGSLAANGGPTLTHALQSGSVAIDAASDCTLPNGAPVTTDQRRVARPQDGDGDSSAACDVGAYEVEAAAAASPSPSPAASPSASPAGTATAPVTPPATDATRLAASTESSLLVAGLIVLAAVALGVGFLVPTWARRVRPARRR